MPPVFHSHTLKTKFLATGYKLNIIMSWIIRCFKIFPTHSFKDLIQILVCECTCCGVGVGGGGEAIHPLWSCLGRGKAEQRRKIMAVAELE